MRLVWYARQLCLKEEKENSEYRQVGEDAAESLSRITVQPEKK